MALHQMRHICSSFFLQYTLFGFCRDITAWTYADESPPSISYGRNQRGRDFYHQQITIVILKSLNRHDWHGQNVTRGTNGGYLLQQSIVYFQSRKFSIVVCT